MNAPQNTPPVSFWRSQRTSTHDDASFHLAAIELQSRDDDDPLLLPVCHWISLHGPSGKAIQKQFHIGYNRLADLKEQLVERGLADASSLPQISGRRFLRDHRLPCHSLCRLYDQVKNLGDSQIVYLLEVYRPDDLWPCLYVSGLAAPEAPQLAVDLLFQAFHPRRELLPATTTWRDAVDFEAEALAISARFLAAEARRHGDTRTDILLRIKAALLKARFHQP